MTDSTEADIVAELRAEAASIYNNPNRDWLIAQAADLITKLRAERDALQHDIERHIEIATSLVAERDAGAKAERSAYFEGAASAFKEAADLLEKASIQGWPHYFRSRCPGGSAILATDREVQS